MHRRIIFVGALLAALAVPSVGSATVAGGCLLSGTASFDPGILYPPQFGSTVRMSAMLTLCTQAPDPGPATGTLSMGNVWKDSSEQKWQEPVGVLQGGCLAAVTRGTAIARWADGTKTVLSIEVHSVFSQLFVSGAVVPGVTLTAVDAQPGQASSVTVTTDRFGVGSVVAGQIQVLGPEGAPITCALGGTKDIALVGGSTITDD